MLDWTVSDPDTLWLNLTNIGLGVCVLICVGVAVAGIGRDIYAKMQARAAKRDVFVYESHSMMLPDLGLTMADGGEPVNDDEPKPKQN